MCLLFGIIELCVKSDFDDAGIVNVNISGDMIAKEDKKKEYGVSHLGSSVDQIALKWDSPMIELFLITQIIYGSKNRFYL